MDFDTNVENYTDNELFKLLNITDISPESIVLATQELIDKYPSNKEIVNFYLDIRNRLIKSDDTNKVFETSIKKGNINPDLKNTISRMINIDSSYRDYTDGEYDSDNYVFTLNEPITNVISLMLYSIEIPQSWYTFLDLKGNTKFKILLNEYDDKLITRFEYPIIQINDGNYTTKALLKHIYDLLCICGIFKNQPNSFSIEQDAYTGRFKLIINSKAKFKDSNFIERNGFLFGIIEIKNRLIFVKKNNFKIRHFFFGYLFS
jgi:hypothetical protein